MKVARWSFGVVVALGLSLFVGCSSEQAPTAPDALSQSPPGETGQPGTEVEEGSNQPGMNKYWGDNIVSEAFYALSQSRSGGSNKSYQGWAMGDWNWVKSDRSADERVTNYIGGCGYRGKSGQGWKGYFRGGECKFFTNLVLYRSSYGWGGNKHLVTPHGYTYANRSTRDAQKGWVIQSASLPHTAVVVERYGGGLDVVDSNWTGGGGKHLVSRHFMSWSDLDRKGFRAWCPWDRPVTIPRSGPRTSCR